MRFFVPVLLWFAPGPAPVADFTAPTGQARAAHSAGDVEQPYGSARRVFVIPDTDFIAEGIAYDADTGTHFVSGVHARAIVRVRQGRVTSFAGGAAGGMLAPLGMVADSRRRLLWVAHAGIKEMRGAAPADLGRTGVLAFDLATGKVKRRALFDSPDSHRFGDLALAPDGRLYVSDALGGRVYRFETTSGKFDPVTAAGALVSAQGLALSADGRTLYIADYAQGLFALELQSGALSPVSHGADVHLYGIDGLARHGDDLIAVQNGQRPHRVMQLRLDDSGRRVREVWTLAASLPEFEVPTLGVVVGGAFHFVANSQWNRFDENGKLPEPSTLDFPQVLRVALEPR